MPDVVAGILINEDRIGLFKRSHLVAGDPGRWHCITGYLPAGTDPLDHARVEIGEETGLGGPDVLLVRRGACLDLPCPDDDVVWRVHPFLFHATHSGLSLNWEHDEYRWVLPTELIELDTVDWLLDVLLALGPSASRAHGLARL